MQLCRDAGVCCSCFPWLRCTSCTTIGHTPRVVAGCLVPHEREQPCCIREAAIGAIRIMIIVLMTHLVFGRETCNYCCCYSNLETRGVSRPPSACEQLLSRISYLCTLTTSSCMGLVCRFATPWTRGSTLRWCAVPSRARQSGCTPQRAWRRAWLPQQLPSVRVRSCSVPKFPLRMDHASLT